MVTEVKRNAWCKLITVESIFIFQGIQTKMDNFLLKNYFRIFEIEVVVPLKMYQHNFFWVHS